ncbi:helix-turn-helix domain-containing protein [Pedobacter sp. HMF7647]|uniref:Helix-turn-helix domain-containing protein n=1 Tax=Hufsiella arboris TaxID=2695275 RepID=A0A7K1YFD2_9SPHI|nr:helix-turn-helix domain-containing protein [Hufsiella arboris]
MKRSANRADISRKTGISTTRLSRLVTEPNSNLRADELYLIALAINVDPCEVQKELFNNLKLEEL